MNTTTFTDADVAALLRIAGEASEIGTDLRVRQTHILDRLLDLIGGVWGVVSEMDPRFAHDRGWSIPSTITHAGGLSEHHQVVINRYLSGTLQWLDPCIPPLLRDPRPTATFRREDVIDRSWYRSEHFYNLRRPLGLGESLYAKVAAPDGRRMKISIQREPRDPPFTMREMKLLQVFHANLPGIYTSARGGAQRVSDERVSQLPPRLQPVLQRLLNGDSEKQAALALKLSPHTIHQYTKTIYRMLGASSRGELLAQFIQSGPMA